MNLLALSLEIGSNLSNLIELVVVVVVLLAVARLLISVLR